MNSQRRVTTFKFVIVGLIVLRIAYVLTDWLGEVNYSRGRNLRAARRVAAAVATREATNGERVRSLDDLAPPRCVGSDACVLGEGSPSGAEFLTEPRRVCILGSCVELNPRERCAGEFCSRIELAPLDANVPTPNLQQCEAAVVRTLEIDDCLERLGCCTPASTCEVIVRGELRALLGGLAQPCRARARTADGKLAILYEVNGAKVSAGVTVSPVPFEPGSLPSTVFCGGCVGELRRIDAGWEFDEQ